MTAKEIHTMEKSVNKAYVNNYMIKKININIFDSKSHFVLPKKKSQALKFYKKHRMNSFNNNSHITLYNKLYKTFSIPLKNSFKNKIIHEAIIGDFVKQIHIPFKNSKFNGLLKYRSRKYKLRLSKVQFAKIYMYY
uniref:Uncharacterized protein n=1 Tax=Amorphochlora amoebiformis TaxID=1561963 RepID=A0A0H5BIH4_9EUKA|nr:hypothetical protein [Amorphochlora amoebiformis]